MPRTLYFYPFRDKTIDSGFVGDISAKTALHFVAPTLARNKFAYLWKMGQGGGTFAKYIGNNDRIYVLGHCSPGSHELSNGTGGVCSFYTLATILSNHGLPKASHAHIRIHACNSGASSPPGAEYQPSFAEGLKRELKRLSHDNVTVRGYESGMGYYFIIREGQTPFTNASNSSNVRDF